MTSVKKTVAAAALAAAWVVASIPGGWASAQQPAPTPKSPATPPPADQGLKIPADVKTVLDRAAAEYMKIPTYRDKAVVAFDMKAKDKSGEDASQTHESELTLVYARPNRFSLDSEDIKVVCDGKTMWASYPRLKQYTENPAPARFDQEDPADAAMAAIGQHAVAMILLRKPTSGADLIEHVTSYEGAKKEDLNGEPGARVTGTIDYSQMNMGEVPFSAWFSAKTGLLGQVRVDLTKPYGEMIANMGGAGGAEGGEEAGGTPTRIDSCVFVMNFKQMKIGEPAADEAFAFKPREGSKKVEDFDFGAAGENDQMELVAKPAPEFSTTTLDGQDFALSSLHGKIVLLDFWATWCPPCVAAIPSVQKISERFADKGVVVIGVNQDPKGADSKVKSFIEKKMITFRQATDWDHDIADKYRVNGIPCMVFIDKDGVVADIHVGGGPGIEEEIAEKVEKMLKGEKLVDEHDLAAMKGDTDAVAPGTGAALEAPSPERLVEGERTAIAAGGMGIVPTDIDHNGHEQLIVPDFQGGVSVVSADGSSVRTIRFKGLRHAPVYSAQPETLGGKRGWLVTYIETLGATSQAGVGFFDDEGATIWTYRPEFPAGMSVQIFAAAGDVNADGKPEVVLGMSAVRADGMSGMKGYLAILDADGKPICLKQVGKNLQSVWIAGPSSGGGPRTIICLADGAAKRFILGPGGSTAEVESPARP